MKPWSILLRVFLFIVIAGLISFSGTLYNFAQEQKKELDAIRDKQDVEAEFNSNKFKYEEDQVRSLRQDLQDAQQQLKDQNDALLQETDKRQELDEQGKNIQTSLVDIKAEADAIKEDMKGWQKDYVGVLAQLNKKMDNSQDELSSLEDNLAALKLPELKENIEDLKADLEKINHPTVENPSTATTFTSDKPLYTTQHIDSTQSQ